jgi:hypothetical protein
MAYGPLAMLQAYGQLIIFQREAVFQSGATPQERHQYAAPVKPGYGWNKSDILPSLSSPPPYPPESDPTATAGQTIQIIRDELVKHNER